MRYMILMVLAALMLMVPMSLLAGIGEKVISVADARELDDNAKVILEGFIVEDLADELYLFRDDTGDINLKIDKKAWKKLEMDPGDLVRVHGRIDRDDDSLTIEVKVKKIKSVKDFHIEKEFEDDDGGYIEEEYIE